MGMQEPYKEFAYEKYDFIKTLIAEVDCEEQMKNVLYKILDMLFHRKLN